MKSTSKHKNENWVKFKNLPGWKAKNMPLLSDYFEICNPDGFYVAVYDSEGKVASVYNGWNGATREVKNGLKNLHTAMQWVYLKTLKPKS